MGFGGGNAPEAFRGGPAGGAGTERGSATGGTKCAWLKSALDADWCKGFLDRESSPTLVSSPILNARTSRFDAGGLPLVGFHQH